METVLANFNDTNPAAPAGRQNVQWQRNGDNISASIPEPGSGLVMSSYTVVYGEVFPFWEVFPVLGDGIVVINYYTTNNLWCETCVGLMYGGGQWAGQFENNNWYTPAEGYYFKIMMITNPTS